MEICMDLDDSMIQAKCWVNQSFPYKPSILEIVFAEFWSINAYTIEIIGANVAMDIRRISISPSKLINKML